MAFPFFSLSLSLAWIRFEYWKGDGNGAEANSHYSKLVLGLAREK